MAKTVLVFAPHADDAEFYAGGTLAKMADEGCQIHIVVVTNGSKGTLDRQTTDLAAIRREEAMRGAAVLGAQPPIMLGYGDLELDCLPAGLLRQQFVRFIRQYRPDVVIAEDALVMDEVHPDHRAVAWAASDAIHFATLPGLCPEHLEEGLMPHFVVEKYFYSNSTATANKIVDISATFARKMAAFAEHRSQVKFLVEDVLGQARLAGLDLVSLMGEAVQDPLEALTWAMRTQAAEIGQKAGYKYGEAFRYVRFHPFIETLLASGE